MIFAIMSHLSTAFPGAKPAGEEPRTQHPVRRTDKSLARYAKERFVASCCPVMYLQQSSRIALGAISADRFKIAACGVVRRYTFEFA